MGHPTSHAKSVREKQADPSRSRANEVAGNPRRSHGGQASIPAFFGIRLTDTAAPARSEVTARPAQAKAVPPSPVRRVGDDQPRRIGGLTFGQRRARVFGGIPPEVIAAMGKAQAELAAKMATAKAAAATTVYSPEPLPTDFDEDQFRVWLDGIHAANRAYRDDEPTTSVRPTPAMDASAAAADERERYSLPDLGEFDRTMPYGSVETACAHNG